MSFGGDEHEGIGLATMRGRDWPSIRQYNVFLANRLGALLDLVRRFESSDVRIIALTVVDSTDCAIIRIVLSDPERALEIFKQAKFPFTESDLLVVQLPEGNTPILRICKALLAAEIGINYAYPVMAGGLARSALAIHVENLEMAACHLNEQNFTLLSEADFREEE